MTRRDRPSLAGYPVNLLVAGRRCVVVGAGRIAARKIEALLDAGAERARRRARRSATEVRALGRRGPPHRSPSAPFAPADLDGAWLATTATDDPAVNRAVFEAGEARRVWVNSADDPAQLLVHPHVGRPAGRSRGHHRDRRPQPGPGDLARAAHWPPSWDPSTRPCSSCFARPGKRCGPSGRSSEDADWRAALDSGMLDLIRAGRVAEAKELLRSCLSSSSD